MLFVIWFCLPLVLLFMYKAHNNTRRVLINYIKLNDHHQVRDKELLKVLHLSDMHLEHISISPEELYQMLKDERLDLIALTGDFLDRKRTIPKLVPYLEALNQLEAKYGMYAVFGNHDYVLNEANFGSLKKMMEAHGCVTLRNQNCSFFVEGKRVNIIGVDDHSTNRSNVRDSYMGLNKGFNLVLTHDPNVVLQMKEYHYDYLLSGHFHGGQILWPKPYHLAAMGKLAKMNMVKGLHTFHGKPFYISEGLGQTGVNIRVGSRPEITIHQLSLSAIPEEKEKARTAV